MGLVVDIVVILLILLCVYKGYKEGLIGIIFSIVTFFLAGVLALVLMNPVADLVVKNTEIDEKIENVIVENFTSDKEENEKAEESEKLPDVILNYIDEYTENAKNATVELAAENLSLLTIKILSFIVIYIVAKIILRILNSILDLVGKLPVIKQFNKLGGTLGGAIKGLLIVYVALGILLLLQNVIGGLGIYSYINASTLGCYIYKNNILLTFILNLF